MYFEIEQNKLKKLNKIIKKHFFEKQMKKVKLNCIYHMSEVMRIRLNEIFQELLNFF